MKAYTRSKAIRSVQYLSAQTKHAWREDKTSEQRVRFDAVPGTNISWTLENGPSPFDPQNTSKKPDYLAAYKKFKANNDVSERKGSQLGIHLLVGVSVEWVEETGRLHDPENPRNKQLLEAAVNWANSWSKGVYAARLDLDETGGAVVDLFVAPVREQKHKNGSSKEVVSVNKALEELSIEVFQKRSKHYAALNTSWSEYASMHLDARLVRGSPKSETNKEHIPPDEYRELMQQANKTLEITKQKEKMAQERLESLEAEKAAFERTIEKERIRLKQDSDKQLNDEIMRLQSVNKEKIERVVDLTVRAIVGTTDGSTNMNAKGRWILSDFSEEDINEIKPFWSKIVPAISKLTDIFTKAKNVFAKLVGIHKEQAEEAVSASKFDIFTKPIKNDPEENDAFDYEPAPEEEDYRPSGP